MYFQFLTNSNNNQAKCRKCNKEHEILNRENAAYLGLFCYSSSSVLHILCDNDTYRFAYLASRRVTDGR